MKQTLTKIVTMMLVAMLSPLSAWACTSMLVSAKASATGRPLMWKNRDTGTEDNFVERVEAVNGRIGYVALFDGGDKNLSQAWMGMNDAGFAVMNTASYNLQPDTARIKDREGVLMTIALQTCRTVNDFENLIAKLRKPLGVQANFGVMDANGGLAYFEVNDHAYRRFNVADTENGYLIRTNFSFAGAKSEGYGYIRYNNVLEVLKDDMEQKQLSPESFTEKASRSFYHSLLKQDFLSGDQTWVVDQDFIPRYSTSASVVIEGVNPGQKVDDMIMWTVLGYAPCSMVMPVRLRAVPSELRPLDEGYTSAWCNRVKEIKHKVFGLPTGEKDRYVNLMILRPVIEQMHAKSMEIYTQVRNPQKAAEAPQQTKPQETKKK